MKSKLSLSLLGFLLILVSCGRSKYIEPTNPVWEQKPSTVDDENDTSDSTGDQDHEEGVVKYATYNIEYDNRNVEDENNLWENRKDRVRQMFETYDFDMVTIDEAYFSQLEDIQDLVPGYQYYGSTVQGLRVDKQLTVGILYKKERFELLNQGRFWLSSTPNVKSMGFGMNQYRICNWGFFEDKELGTQFYVFATHIGFKNTDGQVPSVNLIKDSIRTIAEGYPVLFSGDFNLDQNSDQYQEILSDGLLIDTYDVAETNESLHQTTFGGYGSSLFTGRRIDYIFLANCENFKVESFKILNDAFGSNQYPSDHFPVLIDVKIPDNCQ